MKVSIGFRGRGGTLTIHYESLEQLDDVLHRLTGGGRGRPAAGAGDAAPGADETRAPETPDSLAPDPGPGAG